jgi:molybdopterin-containing oxidoreductase family iron-sulfur binding subunit
MDESRRDFLKKAGITTAGLLGCGFPILKALASRESGPAASGKQWGMVIDIRKCLDERIRRACADACRTAHNLPTSPDPAREIKWIWSDTFGHAFPSRAHSHYAKDLRKRPVLVLCNHCTTPACTKVCPVGATWKREEDGVVMMDMHRCIGCRYCVAACPYGARSFNWGPPRESIKIVNGDYPTRRKGVVEKCTFCAERIRVGLDPVCVVAARSVPGGEGALTFGDVSNPKTEVSRLLRENHTISRSIGFGTGPNVYYIL